MLSDYQRNNQVEINDVRFVHVYVFGEIKLIIGRPQMQAQKSK